MLAQQRGFEPGAGQGHINDIDPHDRRFARVETALENREAHQVGGRDVQCLEEGALQRVFSVFKRKFDFSQSQHGRLGRGCQ